jgi:hypothetical protein
MDEVLLKSLYDRGEYSQFGTFDKFKQDFQDDVNLRRKVYNDLNLSEFGPFSKFQRDVGINPPSSEKNFFDLGAMNNTWLGDLVDDVARATARGYRDGNTIDETLSLMLSGSAVTPENIDDYIEVVKWREEIGQSQEMQDFQNAGGFGTWEGWKQFILKGSGSTIIPELIAESLSGMFANPVTGTIMGAGAAVSAGTAGTGTPVAMPIATGLASGTLESTSKFSELLQEELADQGLPLERESIRDVLEDEVAMARIRSKALRRGITIGTLDALTGKLAGGVGAKVAGKTVKTSKK